MMVLTGRYPYLNRMARAWAARLVAVRSALEREPSYIDAWLWRIQARILTFVVPRVLTRTRAARGPGGLDSRPAETPREHLYDRARFEYLQRRP